MTAGELHDRLMHVGRAADGGGAGRAGGRHADARRRRRRRASTYASKIDKAETRIDWSCRPEVHNQLRGLSPFPGAWCEVDLGGRPERLKLLRSTHGKGSGPAGDDARRPADGRLRRQARSASSKLQRAGGKPVAADEFLRGAKIGTRNDIAHEHDVDTGGDAAGPRGDPAGRGTRIRPEGGGRPGRCAGCRAATPWSNWSRRKKARSSAISCSPAFTWSMPAREFPAVALAPAGGRARRATASGIGGALVREAHIRLKQAGETLAIVLGDPAYYGRFGYDHVSAPRASRATTSATRCRRSPGAKRRKPASWSTRRPSAPTRRLTDWMPRFRLDIEYDGTPYAGWQRQAGQPLGAGGDRAGDLALLRRSRCRCAAPAAPMPASTPPAQVAHVDLARDWPADKVRDAMNAHLQMAGERSRVLAAAVGAGRLRRALLRDRPALSLPHPQPPRAAGAGEEAASGGFRDALDAEAMHEAAQLLLGRHDFTTFRSVAVPGRKPGAHARPARRARRRRDLIEIRASARSFLHNQVRSMVGSLKRVGEGAWTAGRRAGRARGARPRGLRTGGAARRAVSGAASTIPPRSSADAGRAATAAANSVASEATNIAAKTAVATAAPLPTRRMVSRHVSTMETANSTQRQERGDRSRRAGRTAGAAPAAASARR